MKRIQSVMELLMAKRIMWLGSYGGVNSCKECGSTDVVPVKPFGYTEHCRTCDNWQASF